MALQTIGNVQIRGIAACVPSQVEENSSLSLFNEGEYDRFVATTGIERRRKVREGMCASDLCYAAAEKLISGLQWEKSSIDCLVFVSQTPDYKLPSTSCILQHRLGLPQTCMAFDISLGCSGWVYGLQVVANLLASGSLKRALLLVGDTVTQTKSPVDKTTYPLFGDAGSATALEYSPGAAPLQVCTMTDGSNYDAIMIRDGGSRFPVNLESFTVRTYENGSARNNLQSVLDGSVVFTFGISKAPQCVKTLMEYAGTSPDAIDYFVFHQANLLMNEKIRTKLKLPAEKVPYVLKDFGNTSSTSIPLTVVQYVGSADKSQPVRLLACGFGVGLSWGAIMIELSDFYCEKLIEI